MVVGVNGAGKTTSIAKLAHRFSESGKSVVLGAGDTFRAAAVEQLTIWAGRMGAEIVTGRQGSDPASVAYKAVEAGKNDAADVVIVDTAGRLQTQNNLMEELGRIRRVMAKVIPDAPHEVLLVLDATAGQKRHQPGPWIFRSCRLHWDHPCQTRRNRQRWCCHSHSRRIRTTRQVHRARRNTRCFRGIRCRSVRRCTLRRDRHLSSLRLASRQNTPLSRGFQRLNKKALFAHLEQGFFENVGKKKTEQALASTEK